MMLFGMCGLSCLITGGNDKQYTNSPINPPFLFPPSCPSAHSLPVGEGANFEYLIRLVAPSFPRFTVLG